MSINLDTQVRLALSDVCSGHYDVADLKSQLTKSLIDSIVKYSQTNPDLSNELQNYTVWKSNQDMVCFINQSEHKGIMTYIGSFGDVDSNAYRNFCDNLNQEFVPRFDSANNFFMDVTNDFPGCIWSTTGYSLGGSLAIAVANIHNVESDVFNPGYSPIFHETYFPDGSVDNIHIHRTFSDPISASSTIWWNTTSWEVETLSPHGFSNFTDQLDHYEELSTMNRDPLSMLQKLTTNIDISEIYKYWANITEILNTSGLNVFAELSMAEQLNAAIYEIQIFDKTFQVAVHINNDIGQITSGLFVDGSSVDWVIHLSIDLLREILHMIPLHIVETVIRIIWVTTYSLVRVIFKHLFLEDVNGNENFSCDTEKKEEGLNQVREVDNDATEVEKASQPILQAVNELSEIAPSVVRNDPIAVIDATIRTVSRVLGATDNSVCKAISKAIMYISDTYRSDVVNLMSQPNEALFGLQSFEYSTSIAGKPVNICIQYEIDFKNMQLHAGVFVNGVQADFVALPLSLGKRAILSQLPVKLSVSAIRVIFAALFKLQDSAKSRNNTNNNLDAQRLMDLDHLHSNLEMNDVVPKSVPHLSLESFANNSVELLLSKPVEGLLLESIAPETAPLFVPFLV